MSKHDEVKLLPLNVEWHASTEAPPTPTGTNRYYIVAVRRAQKGEVYTFPAQHLNGYPLLYGDRGCGGDRTKQCPEDGSHEEGCPTTGWFNEAEGGEYDSTYTPLYMSPGDEFLAWSQIPRYDRALSGIPAPGSGETGWRDIASAPKDGTKFLAYSTRNGSYDLLRWMEGQDGYTDHFVSMLGYGGSPIAFVTHWQPLPSPANPAETQAVEVGK